MTVSLSLTILTAVLLNGAGFWSRYIGGGRSGWCAMCVRWSGVDREILLLLLLHRDATRMRRNRECNVFDDITIRRVQKRYM